MISDGASAHRPPQHPRRKAHAAPDWARTQGVRALALALALALGFLVTGCQVGPDYQPPVPPTLTSFSRASGGLGEPGPVETTWWRRFQDPLLDELIARVSTHNLDLRLAQARLLEARALWTAARFDLAPTVVNENSYQNSQTSRATRPNEPRHLRHNEVYRFGFDATWELDFWGRARRGIEAARATVAAVEAERDDVLVAVRAELAANYLELRGLQGQLEVARRNATNQAETLRLAEALRDGGQGTQLDVARARSQLATTRAGIPAVEAATDHALHRIALLCGWPAAEHAPLLERLTPPAPLPEPASGIALGHPEDLFRRRPDIRTSERQLAAATASIGLQVADLFPRLTVSGNVALEANRLSGFSGPGLDAWGFGPRLSWAAFDLGRVRQRIRAADARAHAALAAYEKTVLLALEEVANALVSVSRERERLALLIEAENAAAEAVDLARQRYRDGIADFLSVLDSERTLLTLQDQRVASHTQALTRLVALYKALGGGWELGTAGIPTVETSTPAPGSVSTSPSPPAPVP